MPIPYSGPGAGVHAYWRNTTKHGTINCGDEDFAPGGAFHGMENRRAEIYAAKLGFEPFAFGDRGARIGPGKVWHDTGYVLGRCQEKTGLGGNWWIAFEDTPEGREEFNELQFKNVHLQAHAFENVWKDPFKGRDGKHREIRRFGFHGTFALMALLEDVSVSFDRVANGVMDVPALARDAAEAPRLREENAAKAIEIEELKAKIREHEEKSAAAAAAAEVAAVASAEALAPVTRGPRRGG